MTTVNQPGRGEHPLHGPRPGSPPPLPLEPGHLGPAGAEPPGSDPGRPEGAARRAARAAQTGLWWLLCHGGELAAVGVPLPVAAVWSWWLAVVSVAVAAVWGWREWRLLHPRGRRRAER